MQSLDKDAAASFCRGFCWHQVRSWRLLWYLLRNLGWRLEQKKFRSALAWKGPMDTVERFIKVGELSSSFSGSESFGKTNCKLLNFSQINVSDWASYHIEQKYHFSKCSKVKYDSLSKSWSEDQTNLNISTVLYYVECSTPWWSSSHPSITTKNLPYCNMDRFEIFFTNDCPHGVLTNRTYLHCQ